MKTVELTPTWEAALNICTTVLNRSVSDVKSRRGKNDLESRIIMLRDTFLPLCRSIDAKNEEIRAANAAKEPTVCAACADTLPCGHATVDEEAKCALCGGEGEI